MRIIEVHVPNLDEFIAQLDNLVMKKRLVPVKSHVKTTPKDSHWFYAYIEDSRYIVVLDLDYDPMKGMCKIAIHTGLPNWESVVSSPRLENMMAQYWERYDAQMIDHNPPPMPPPPPPSPPPMKWSDLIPCPFCDAGYRYPQSLVDEGKTVNCQNCGKRFDL